jgi:20S proteasome alpha/beta subunit
MRKLTPRTGKDFVLLASDQSAGRSIIKMKSDENKIRKLSPGLAMAFGGEPGECAARVEGMAEVDEAVIEGKRDEVLSRL